MTEWYLFDFNNRNADKMANNRCIAITCILITEEFQSVKYIMYQLQQ